MVMRRLRPRRGDAGFTLIETMASLLVFSIVTLGLVPLLAASLKGSALSRSYTAGKNVAIDAMERVRGLPYFISYASKNKRVDVLDLYYPNRTGGYSAGVYTTTCSAASTDPACPKTLPPGMTITFKATFIKTSVYQASPIVYAIVTPPTTYRWDSATGLDLPPSQLAEVSVKASWTMGTETKEYSLKTLIGDRKFGQIAVSGSARVDYGLQALTGYDVTGVTSELNVTAGFAESKVETKLLSAADQSLSAGQIRLVRSSTDPTVPGSPIGGTPLVSAETAVHAPPDVAPLGTSAAAQTLLHPDWLTNGTPTAAAFLDASATSGTEAAVDNELPRSAGLASVNTTGSSMAMWLDNQADRTQDAATIFNFHTSDKMLQVVKGTRTIQGETKATTTASTAADRKVELFADTKLGEVRLLPTNYISGSEKTVIRISDFRATATCKSTGNAATATATGSWSATLRYFRDTNPLDNVQAGSYQSVVLNSASLGTTLADLRTQNPLVYDHSSAGKDVHLFKTDAVLNGYLANWSAAAPVVTKSADGRITSVNIDGALRIDTAPTSALRPNSVISLSLGKLSCQAVDNR